MSVTRYLILLGGLLLSACATTAPVTKPDNLCHFRRWQLEVEQPSGALGTASEAPLAAPPPPTGTPPAKAARPVDNAYLLLSGGSQNGAFGAGYLAEWHRQGGQLPHFRTVTGISTGAILASWAFIDEPEVMERAYSIKKESELLTAYARYNSKHELTLPSYLALARHNALADLGPLRSKLFGLLDERTLRTIATQPNERALQIGAVDSDTGQAVIFDMVHMARKAIAAHDAGDTPGFARYRGCYADAIVASSSVPMAARPAFIDNRMYVDGGARFGLFVRDFGDTSKALAPYTDGQNGNQPPTVYLIVNGTQQVSPECGRIDESKCPGGFDPPFDLKDPHRKWDLASAGLRATDILANQIYRFSVADLAARYRASYGEQAYARHFHFTRINRKTMLAHPYPRDGGKSCREWQELDWQQSRPLQFYPHFMACLIDYGNARATGQHWWDVQSLSDEL